MGNNGDKPEKTQEELKAERLKRYQDNPNDFIEISDLACAAMLSKKSNLGISVMVGNISRSLLDVAQVALNHMIDKIRIRMDVQSEMQKASMIQQPGAMHRFANKVMGR
jgi:hypothetical protein